MMNNMLFILDDQSL